MSERKKTVSSYIYNSRVERRSNIFLENIIRFLFRKVNFDIESINHLQEASKKGRVVYVSFQSSFTTLIILVNLLRRNRFPIPVMALDFTPYLFQAVSSALKRFFRSIKRAASKEKFEQVGDIDFIQETVREGNSIILSLLSRKLFKKRFLDIKSDSLQYLVELQQEMDEPIIICPHILFWNRNPDRTKMIITPRSTRDRGLIAGLLTRMRSSTLPLMKIATPINLRDEINRSPSDDSRHIARNVRNMLLEQYSHEKRTVLGPVIKSSQEMIERVLYHRNVLETVSEMAKNKKYSERKLRKMAFKYYREIAANFSIFYIKYFEKTFDYVMNRIFDGIEYNQDDFRMIREAAQKGPLILMPSHKSHMDYLILSKIFFRNNLIPPHILAGANLTFWPMGKIFRKSGAFFMRRSFKGLDLYAAVFRQYVKTLINEGYSIEFFIEGGRTRTGRIVHPKMGMLKYLIEAVEEGYHTEMVFIPLSINYDRIVEETAYFRELRGKEKKEETTSGFFKSRKLLKKSYGKVYLAFNEPVLYSELKKKYAKTDEITIEIGYDLIRRINEVVQVTPVALTTTAILASSGKGFSRDVINETMMLLFDYLDFNNIPMSRSLKPGKEYSDIIDYVLETYEDDHIIRKLEEGGEEEADVLTGIYALADDNRARINFYKNSIIQHFLPVSFISLVLLCSSGDECPFSEIEEEYEYIKRLFSKEFIYPEHMNDTAKTVENNLEFLSREGALTVDEKIVSLNAGGEKMLRTFSRLIQEYLESYLVVLTSFSDVQKKLHKRDLIHEIRKHGIQMYHLGEIRLSESLSSPNYTTGLTRFAGFGLIEETPGGKRIVDVTIKDLKGAEEIRQKVKGYLAKVQ